MKLLLNFAGWTLLLTSAWSQEVDPRPADWRFGPFVKRPQPVLSPNADSRFHCPVLGEEVRWEAQNVYNPAAVVRADKVYLFYRADDRNPDLKWGRTCRIGMAWSEDGVQFTRHPTPVLYPDHDAWKAYEWEGGCEDLHIVEGEDGLYYMNYTTWNGTQDTVSVASSRDLLHWTKHGPAFRKANQIGGRSGVVVSRLVGDRLVAAKLRGKYWMYYTHPCALAWSENLIDWTPTGEAVWPGGGREAGAIALLRQDGILLMTQGGHPSRGAWVLRQALLRCDHLTTLLHEDHEPFLWPELEWEKRGFVPDTTVANTLVPFRGRWLLYYGGADRCIGLAEWSGRTADTTLSAPAHAPATPRSAGALDHLTLTVDRKVLNPVREPHVTAKLTLTGHYADGSQRVLELTNALVRAKTKEASGNVEVVALEGDRVIPREGGIATVEATVVQNGRSLQAATEVVVRPFYRDYHQTLVLKLFLGMEGDPVERLAKEPLFQKPHDVLCTFEEALEVIRKTDNLTRGIPKILYLVGWQKGGHDHGYPAWNDVNPRLARPQDPSPVDSLRWLIREARAFNTTVSLHLNMVDAYRQSPLWEEYLANDCFAKDAQGQLLVAGIQMKGEEMYNVVYPREWAAGLAQQRIDRLIQMLPELRDGHTIHVDVFIAQREGGQPISPWHARPEHGGLTPDKYVETQRKIFRYWRDRGFDVTGEGIFWAHPPGEGFTGLQAMSWWYPGDPGYSMRIPEALMARGRTDRGGDGDFRFGSSMHGEEIWQRDKENMPGFLGMFCRTTLPWSYLSRFERERFENDTLTYSNGLVALTEAGKRIIRHGQLVLREDDDLFVPALWHPREIIAYSRPGYAQKTWPLPENWRDVTTVELRRITLEGLQPLQSKVPVHAAQLVLSLQPDTALSIVPSRNPASP